MIIFGFCRLDFGRNFGCDKDFLPVDSESDRLSDAFFITVALAIDMLVSGFKAEARCHNILTVRYLLGTESCLGFDSVIESKCFIHSFIDFMKLISQVL